MTTLVVSTGCANPPTLVGSLVDIRVFLNVNTKESKMRRNQKFCLDKRDFVTILFLIILCVMTSATFADTLSSRKDIILQGKILKVLLNGEYKELKRGDFYGYGWLDDHRIFIAFQQKGYSEAIINSEVIDLRKSKVIELGTIMEADGETNFDVNPNTSEVVFNGSELDKTGSDEFIGVIKLMVFDAKNNKPSIETIKTKIDCKNVLWVDNNTIGATLFDKQGTFVTFPVPRH